MTTKRNDAAEIIRLKRLVQRQRATINRLRGELAQEQLFRRQDTRSASDELGSLHALNAGLLERCHGLEAEISKALSPPPVAYFRGQWDAPTSAPASASLWQRFKSWLGW